MDITKSQNRLVAAKLISQFLFVQNCPYRMQYKKNKTEIFLLALKNTLHKHR